MKKLVVVGAGVFAAGSVALGAAGIATSQPNGGTLNVVGEPYIKAVQILKSQGVKATFGGSFGSVLSQSNCLVDSQKANRSGKMLLMLDCSQAAADMIADQGPSSGPSVGSNGVTTVVATPVVPIGGAPGAGAPPAG